MLYQRLLGWNSPKTVQISNLFSSRFCNMLAVIAIAIVLGTMALASRAVMAEPAVIFDMGGKFDKSFNESAYNGAEAYKKETGNPYLEFEISTAAQREQALTRMAQRGADPIVAIGFMQGPVIDKVAPKFPESRFTVIDAVAQDQPNVQSVIFKEQEGSFLAGALAAMKTKSNTIGFVGGMDIPLIHTFACGYTQGAKYVNKDIKVLRNMIGITPAAWNDPTKGGEIALSQLQRGADIVFAAAGGSGVGVYQKAKENGIYAIGVDSNQNYLFPGTMLTSMVKRVDEAVRLSFTSGADGSWQAGTKNLGLKENGVGLAFDEYNADLVDDAMRQRITEIEKMVINGDIVVHKYSDDNSCPSY